MPEPTFRIDLARVGDNTVTAYPSLTYDEAKEFSRRIAMSPGLAQNIRQETCIRPRRP